MHSSFYRIDWDTCERLQLFGREAMVYSALVYLCKHTPYTGSATDLANFSHCGKKMTTLRMLSSLEEKGLIIRGNDGISLAQIETRSAQNETPSAQNETISKEKEKKQKNKENTTKERVRENKREPHAPTLVFDKNKVFNPPYWDEWRTFAESVKIDEIVYKKAWCYYMMRGWEGVREWKAALLYWDLKNKT